MPDYRLNAMLININYGILYLVIVADVVILWCLFIKKLMNNVKRTNGFLIFTRYYKNYLKCTLSKEQNSFENLLDVLYSRNLGLYIKILIILNYLKPQLNCENGITAIYLFVYFANSTKFVNFFLKMSH